jgi:hypothetical protein
MSAFDEDELRKFVDYVKEFMCDSTRIIYINDFDLMKLDMKDFDKNVYFISNQYFLQQANANIKFSCLVLISQLTNKYKKV